MVILSLNTCYSRVNYNLCRLRNDKMFGQCLPHFTTVALGVMKVHILVCVGSN